VKGQLEQTFKILAEVLEKHPIDGTFFNGAAQRMSDNNGNTYAPCTSRLRAKESVTDSERGKGESRSL
jgi:hypothetical protein